MFKNNYVRLGIINLVTLVSLLIVLPLIPIKIGLNNYSVGGYYINILNGKFIKDLRDFKFGLDIQGGVRIVLNADMSKIPAADRPKALEASREIIERRVNLLGVSEPYITTSRSDDQYRIVAEIPGITDSAEAVNLIGQTAQLTFRQLKADQTWDPARILEIYSNPMFWEDTGLTGSDLKDVDVTFAQGLDQNAGKPQIVLKFTDEGRNKFAQIARNNSNKPIGIYLDTNPYPLSMPIINPELANGIINDPVITGDFDTESANQLSIQLRAGALPVPISVLEQKTIGATLGDESVKASFFAGVVGLILVLVFLIFNYGILGVLASVSLIIYSLISLAVFKFIPVIMTLPGIAGFILSIGIAADANILIFERIKEELRWGKSKNLANRLGFERAWSSIKDSNIASLLTSGVLFYFGTGPVKGFAVTLAIGIFVSLFTSIFVTRTFINLFLKGHNEDN